MITGGENDFSEIVIYQSEDGEISLDVVLEDETVWLSQEQMGKLFGKDKRTISEHIQSIFSEGELDESGVVRNFRTATRHGAMPDRKQTHSVRFYNLDVIISVGYRVRSLQGTRFRIWATRRLREYIVKGFALNDDRFKSGHSMNYFEQLQERIRAIRLSERFFYQKIKDIYTTSIDYDPKDEKTLTFFKTVQNKLLWAISEQTAAELVYRRTNAALPLMGMQSFDKNTSVGITKKDVSIAKNYLDEEEMKLLGLLVEQYLAFAETMAQQHRPMTMSDWIDRLDAIISLNGRELLTHAGRISHEMAVEKSSIEYKKYQELKRTVEREESIKELESDLNRLEFHKKPDDA